MSNVSNTLGMFIAELMRRKGHNNVSLAAAANVSEGVVRNLLKHGIDAKSKDPDPRTLRRVADALDVDALRLFRLAGYIPPAPAAQSVRAEYLAETFDTLPPEKQDAVMGVLEAMVDKPERKTAIHEMRTNPQNPIAGIDIGLPNLARTMANHLIAHYQMIDPAHVELIKPDVNVLHYKWKELPASTQERVKALIRHKLSLDYDPTMVDPEWRS